LKKILIVEDDNSIAAIERDYLIANGYNVEIKADGKNGLNSALMGEYDLVLLDVMLPVIDGFEICRRVRSALKIPILMVTAKKDDIDKIRALGLGADDYIVKPFSPNELVARVKSHIAMVERLTDGDTAIGNKEITLGAVRINPKTHRVFVKNVEVELKNKEYELLLFLVLNADSVFSKETLYERIWGMDSYGDNATIAVHINRIREKIETDPSSPQYIQTVWGAGYRFKA
jgi:DNA-binding response OmpR family regulator